MSVSRHHYLPFRFHKRHWDMEIVEYYIFQLLYSTAYTTLNLFVPIFLIERGYSLWQVMAYFVINQLWFVLAMPFVGKFIRKLGIKHAMALHLPFLAMFYFGLQNLSGVFFSDLWLLVIILGLRGFFKAIYNVADTTFVAKHLFKKRQTGKNLAFVRIIFVVAGVLAPVTGGLIAYFWGFNAVFTVGIMLVLASGIPLLMTPDEHFELGYDPGKIYNLANQKADRNFLLAEIGRVLPDTLMWIMWPMFIYFVVKNTANMGLLVSLSALISMIVAFYVGKKVDSKNPEKMLKKAAHGATGLFFYELFLLTHG